MLNTRYVARYNECKYKLENAVTADNQCLLRIGVSFYNYYYNGDFLSEERMFIDPNGLARLLSYNNDIGYDKKYCIGYTYHNNNRYICVISNDTSDEKIYLAVPCIDDKLGDSACWFLIKRVNADISSDPNVFAEMTSSSNAFTITD